MQKEIKFLVDEAERILFALQDGDLEQGNYATLARAIEGVKAAEQITASDGCADCGSKYIVPNQKVVQCALCGSNRRA